MMFHDSRRWLHLGFLLWTVFSLSWLANSVRTRGVAPDTLRSSQTVTVLNETTTLAFLPTVSQGRPALVFICGSGVSAAAYAPLLRPVADAGFAVFVIRLPYRFAPFEAHKQAAIERVRRLIATRQEFSRWVVAGHSLGAALAARLARSDAGLFSALVLIGTTHPKRDDLAFLRIPVTKVFASNDGVAPVNRVLANRELLPAHTNWVEVAGGNHSQFGRYGHQLFDGHATISREEQEAATRSAILQALAGVEGAHAIVADRPF